MDDGVILLVAPTERKVRIEVGYGLTPVLTAALSGIIIRDTILPHFKANDYPGGIRAGAGEILEQLRLPSEQAEARAARIIREQGVQAPARAASNNGPGFGTILIGLFILIFVILPLLRRRSGRRHRSGGGLGGLGQVILWSALDSAMRGGSRGGGGFGGFGGGGGGGGFSGGGGSFGGGGSSGSW